MKTVTPEKLNESYLELNREMFDQTRPRSDGIMKMFVEAADRWLELYQRHPDRALSTVKTNSYGKNTAALFHALGIKQPRKKSDMIAILTEGTENQ